MVRPDDIKGSSEGKDTKGGQGNGVISTEITPQDFYKRKKTGNKDQRSRKYDKDTEKTKTPLKRRLLGLTQGKPDTEIQGNSSISTVGLLQGES